MAQQQQVSIKAKCKDVTRLLTIRKDLPYEDFCDLLKDSFGISQCQLQYRDEEGDLIHLGSEVELQEALKVAEEFGPLKVTILSSECPTIMSIGQNQATNSSPMLATNQSGVVSQPGLVDQGDASISRFTDDTSNSESPLVDPVTNLQINDRPRERKTPRSGQRSSRKRLGFYASLCNDVAALELGSSSGSRPNNEYNRASEKPKKKHKKSSSKYYSSLAEDVAAMNLLTDSGADKDKDESDSVIKSTDGGQEKQPEMRNRQRDLPPNLSMEELEKGTRRLSLGEDKPPSWFRNAVDEMSQSISSQVLSALNGAVIASISTTNGKPAQGIKRDYATYMHDGITCDGCHQTIIGPRYKCGNCPDYDLCEQCEGIEGIHNSSHVFLKLRFPGIGIGRKHGVMIPLLKDIIYKSKNVELAEEQERTMKEVRKKLKQLAKKKREEQVRLKKGERRVKKFKGSTHSEVAVCDLQLVFLGDGSHPDGTAVPPETEFTKVWKIRNGGNTAWNDKTKLICMYGAIRCISNEVELPHLQPSEEGTVGVNFFAPAEPGPYFSVWRASHNGRNFGSKMWCKIKVVPEERQSDDDDETFVDASESPSSNLNTSCEPEQLASQSSEAGLEKVEDSIQETEVVSGDNEEEVLPNFHGYTVLESTPIMSEEPASVEPANVTSPSLPDCELEWDTCLMDNETCKIMEEEMRCDVGGSNDEDLLDIEVISNASSDDFCVVLPACFNPDIPLNHDAVDPQDPLGSPEEEEQEETTIPESETDTQVDALREQNLAEFSRSAPIPIRVANEVAETAIKGGVENAALYIDHPTSRPDAVNKRQSSLPGFVRTSVSQPAAPQPPSLERNPFVHGRIPASPPGRAVPVVVQTNVSHQPAISLPPCFRARPDSGATSVDSAGQNAADTVRTQPADAIVVSRSVAEKPVTSQPEAVPTVLPTQSTAQFASTFVSDTMATAKRALGTVAGTVTTLISGRDGRVTVHYDQGGNNVHVIVPEPTETARSGGTPARPGTSTSEMQQLIDMGFCDRPLNERLLKKFNNDVGKVVTELLHESDNDWSNRRHVAH